YIDACVRMIRADYCGSGESWTVNGRTLDIFDGVGVQDPSNPEWQFEAEWSPTGARCVTSTRIDWTQRGSASCIADLNLATPGCGDAAHFANGTLLMERYMTRLTQ